MMEKTWLRYKEDARPVEELGPVGGGGWGQLEEEAGASWNGAL